jgi:hypothetical protein
MPSILSKADRRVLRYFNKYGFDNVRLILYILDASWRQERGIVISREWRTATQHSESP